MAHGSAGCAGSMAASASGDTSGALLMAEGKTKAGTSNGESRSERDRGDALKQPDLMRSHSLLQGQHQGDGSKPFMMSLPPWSNHLPSGSTLNTGDYHSA